MKDENEIRAENFRPLDYSVTTNLRYTIEAEKQVEAYTNALNRRKNAQLRNDYLFTLLWSIVKGLYYFLSGVIFLLIKSFKK